MTSKPWPSERHQMRRILRRLLAKPHRFPTNCRGTRFPYTSARWEPRECVASNASWRCVGDLNCIPWHRDRPARRSHASSGLQSSLTMYAFVGAGCFALSASVRSLRPHCSGQRRSRRVMAACHCPAAAASFTAPTARICVFAWAFLKACQKRKYIAPDLRGRGRSCSVSWEMGLRPAVHFFGFALTCVRP